MKKTIFLSSTFHDLQPHRNELWKVLQDFDINITGMEAFGARKSTPLQTCLKEIEKSDIYIGIISMCYGSVDEITGKSYTQLEYEKAKEKGLEILIYLVNERLGEVKTGNIDFGEKSLSLNSFKRILKSNHTVDFYINETDLGQKLFKRLEKIIPKPGQLITRPEILEAKVKRIELKGSHWCIFIGYLNGKPFEIFTGLADHEDGILLPRSVTSGWIVKSKDESGATRYDFQYPNSRGYKTTIEGINFTFSLQLNTFDKIITSLLQSNVDFQIIIETIKQMEAEKMELKDWNKLIPEILQE